MRYTNNRRSNTLLVLIAWVLLVGDTQHDVVESFSPAVRTWHFPSSTTLFSSLRKENASSMMKDMQAEFGKTEEGSLIMDALRGRNLNNDDSAVAGLQMRLIDVDAGTGLPFEYNPVALKRFFSKRPLTVITRIVQLSTVGGGFVIQLVLDQVLKRSSPDLEVKRATQLRNLLTSLGPFYIKVGQALSIRPDILSPRSMVELQKLCDKVPSFDSKIAFQTVQSEMGQSVDELFSEITPEPVAAASLGQVYKATLRANGDTVAVKVQRPGVLETVSLDLYLAREVGLLLRKLPLEQPIDAVALLDEFAYRFYQELDYNLECENGLRMERDMKILPMVKVPTNYPSYTARRVHVAEWIDGEKLSSSTADDVSALVNLGVITYMTQLLESGFFHADPHPGNMLRTTDGKLAILDFGLMTEITDDQKYGMVEAIAHLINRDYSEIGNDFINLGFIPKGTDTAPIVPALTKVFDVALAGGGAKSINFQELAADLAEITYEYPFKIPPYFALIIRAISVLEGIALVGNPNFAIIDEAYPYIARRLMTDRSPRLRAALRYMIYGKEGVFDAENAIDLLQALEKFTAVRDEGDGSAYKVDGVRGSKVVGAAGDFRGSQVVDTSERDGDSRFQVGKGNSLVVQTVAATKQDDERTVREALRFFFSPEGKVFREFMLEEVVTVIDASGRGVVEELRRRLGWGRVIPGFSGSSLTEKDKKTVEQIQILMEFLLGKYEGAGSARVRQLVPVLREYAPQLREFGLLLAVRLTEKNLSRGMSWANQRLAYAEGVSSRPTFRR